MSDQRRDLYQMEDLLDQARKDWVEAERQRLLSRSIDYAASIQRGIDKSRAGKNHIERLHYQTYSVAIMELSKSAEYAFNIPAVEFLERAKEKSKK